MPGVLSATCEQRKTEADDLHLELDQKRLKEEKMDQRNLKHENLDPRSEKLKQKVDSHRAIVNRIPPINGFPTSKTAGINGEVTGKSSVNEIKVEEEEKETMLVDPLAHQIPPEIQHVTQGFVSLSLLIHRLSQETFNQMDRTITDLVDMDSGPRSDDDREKKARLFTWATDTRARFIKVLVLSQWAKKSEEIGRLVDVNHWLSLQKESYKNAISWVGELNRILTTQNVPRPDIPTVLESLSTGKAAWISNMGYVPPAKLTAREMLQTLRTLNAALTLRLHLHETIPLGFRNFRVADGRVTFHVPGEFELDLSIADEDSTKQFFFIDFRFDFAPSMTEIPPSRIRSEIEGKVNAVLVTEGLAGCYDCLHDLVLTHKLSLLRSQAFELKRGRWSEDITIELVHRSVVVQYWTNRPGAKNWIEIGMKSGKRKRHSTSKPLGTSFIDMRWHRHGKEVHDHSIDLHLDHLSMEQILLRVLNVHINHILRETKRKLHSSPLYANKILSAKHRASSDPLSSSLAVQLTRSTSTIITLDPTAGRFILTPPTRLHSFAERELARLRDPASDAAVRLAALRAASALDQLDSRARLVPWLPITHLRPGSDALTRLFAPTVGPVARFACYRPRSWHSTWILCATTSLSADAWWVVRLHDPRTTQSVPKDGAAAYGVAPVSPFAEAFRIHPVRSGELLFAATLPALVNVEAVSAALVVHHSIAHEAFSRLMLNRTHTSKLTSNFSSILTSIASNQSASHIATSKSSSQTSAQTNTTSTINNNPRTTTYITNITTSRPPTHAHRALEPQPAIAVPDLSLRLAPIRPPAWCSPILKLSFAGLTSRRAVALLARGRLLKPLAVHLVLNKEMSVIDSHIGMGKEAPTSDSAGEIGDVGEEKAKVTTGKSDGQDSNGSESAAIGLVDPHVAFHRSDGTFAFRIEAIPGQRVISPMLEMVNRIGRLIGLVGMATRAGMTCEKVGLTSLTVRYGYRDGAAFNALANGKDTTDPSSGPIPTIHTDNLLFHLPAADLRSTTALSSRQETLTATISFPSGTDPLIIFPLGNPHLRIADHLTTVLRGPAGFERVVTLLRHTQSLLVAFAAIEEDAISPDTMAMYPDATPTDGKPQEVDMSGKTVFRNASPTATILSRSAAAYRVQYRNPTFAYNVGRRERGDRTLWHLRLASAPDPHAGTGPLIKHPPPSLHTPMANTVNPNANTKASPTTAAAAATANAPAQARVNAATKAASDYSRTADVRIGWDLLCASKCRDWWGVGDGVVADLDGVADVVLRIHGLVRSIGGRGGGEEGGGEEGGGEEGGEEEAEEEEEEDGGGDGDGEAVNRGIVIDESAFTAAGGGGGSGGSGRSGRSIGGGKGEVVVLD